MSETMARSDTPFIYPSFPGSSIAINHDSFLVLPAWLIWRFGFIH